MCDCPKNSFGNQGKIDYKSCLLCSCNARIVGVCNHNVVNLCGKNYATQNKLYQAFACMWTFIIQSTKLITPLNTKWRQYNKTPKIHNRAIIKFYWKHPHTITVLHNNYILMRTITNVIALMIQLHLSHVCIFYLRSRHNNFLTSDALPSSMPLPPLA